MRGWRDKSLQGAFNKVDSLTGIIFFLVAAQFILMIVVPLIQGGLELVLRPERLGKMAKLECRDTRFPIKLDRIQNIDGALDN